MQQLFAFFRLFWVAICALSLMAQTRLLLHYPLEPGWLDGFVFGGTVFGYYWTQPQRWRRIVAWSAGILGGICLIMYWKQSPQSLGGLATLLIPIFFWLAYYGFQRPGNTGLRGHPFAKPLTIALTWAWVTVLFPLASTFKLEWMGLLLGRASFIFALALAYDLCDAAYDQQFGLSTLTSKLGFDRSIRLIYKSLSLSGACVGANLLGEIYTPAKAIALIFSLGLSAWILPQILQQKNLRSWQKVWIDGLMVLQWALVGLAGWG